MNMTLHKTNPTWGVTECGLTLNRARPLYTCTDWQFVNCKECLKRKPKRKGNNQ
jgi:hypothetical protein